MLLRTKLIIGFSCILLLTALIIVVAYRSLNDLGATSVSTTNVASSFALLQRAELESQFFMRTPRKEIAEQVRQKIESSRQQLATVRKAEAGKPDRVRMLNTVDDMMKQFGVLFSQMETEAGRVQSADDKMVTYSAPAMEASATVQKAVAEFCRQDPNPESFRAYELVRDAEHTFMWARMTSWVFTATSTVEVATQMDNFLLEAIDDLKQALPLMRKEENKKLTQYFIEQLQGYQTSARLYNEAFLKQIAVANTMKAHVEKTMETVNTVNQEYNLTLKGQLEKTKLQLTIAGSLALLMGLFAAWILTRNVLNQLGRDPHVLEEAATNVIAGNFDIDDGKEKKGVYANFIRMVVALKENMAQVKRETARAQEAALKAQEATRTAEEAQKQAEYARRDGMLAAAGHLEGAVAIITEASARLSTQIENSRRGAMEQASRVAETATAMEEMNSTVLEVAKNAGNAADASTVTRNKAEKGAHIVRQAVNSIQTVQQQAVIMRDDMRQLDESAKAISQIMSVISDIADQTNLLALNAAIEAARAGDAGRGFAVVADEVRKLAEKTMASTSDVGNAVRGIQQSTNQSIAQMDAAVRSIEEATGFAEQSGQALEEIVDMVDTSADQVRAIATAAEEQSATSDEINRSVNQVNVIAEQTSGIMQEAACAVTELARQAKVLDALIVDMKKS